MTPQTGTPALDVEQRLTDIEARLAALEATRELFIDEPQAHRNAEGESRRELWRCYSDPNRRYAGLSRVEKRIDKMCFGLITSQSDRAFYVKLAILIAEGAIIGWYIGSAL